MSSRACDRLRRLKLLLVREPSFLVRLKWLTQADLTQRPNFVTPFLIACGTKNVKFTGIALVCLQKLVVARALPRGRLREVLEALREATAAGLDVQLKILQSLPSLLQNYADDLKGDLLAASLNICTILQASKNGIVNNTAAATLQQLVVSVFDKVVDEDSKFKNSLSFLSN